MLTQSSGPLDHSRRVESLVRRWLQDRQALILLMMEVRGEQAVPDAAPMAQRVQGLCEALLDYVSAGHFEIYDELLAEAEQRGSLHLASGLALYPQLQASTDVVLRFNDLHEGPAETDLLATLSQELAELMPALEQRFEIEDRMIALLHEHGGQRQRQPEL